MPCTGGGDMARVVVLVSMAVSLVSAAGRPPQDLEALSDDDDVRGFRTTTMPGGLLWNCSGQVGFRLVWRRKTRRPRTPCGSSANVAATALAKRGYERMWRRAGSTGALGPKRRRGTKTFSFSSISSRTLRPCLQRWLRPGPARLRWLCPGLALLRWLCPRLARLRCLCPSPTSGRSRDTKSSVACFVFGLSKESGE